MSSGFVDFQLSGGRFFFGKLLAQKLQISLILEGKGYIVESCLYSKLGNDNVFADNRCIIF